MSLYLVPSKNICWPFLNKGLSDLSAGMLVLPDESFGEDVRLSPTEFLAEV